MGICYYKGNIPIINDDPATKDLAHPWDVRTGMEQRNYKLYPPEMFAPPSEMTVISPSDWDAWYDEQEAQESSLEHLFLRGGNPAFVNLDQNGDGYCWAYSTGHSLMMDRLKRGMLVPRLNPHSVAAIIKRGRDEGGWCGLSAKFSFEVGYAEEGTGPGQWPLHSRSLKYDTAECRVAMAKNKTTEEWRDLSRDEYDQQLTLNQYATALLMNQPSPSDFNWWGHSVCAIRWVRIERGSWGPLILNSWKGWGRFGLGVLQGTKGRPDGALSILSTTVPLAA